MEEKTDFNKIADESRASIEHADLKVLLPLVAEINPKVILEIGMHQGYSMEVWRRAFDPGVLIGIEINSPTPESYVDEYFMMWNTDSHNRDPKEVIIGVVHYPLLNDISFLFIDGDHSYEGVKKDFEMYSPLVKKGGIIAFHDALYHHDGTEEVDTFWDEIKHKYKYLEIKESPHSTGIGIIYV